MTSLGNRFGRFMLRIFPPDFRNRYGDDIADHFVRRSREVRAQRGLAGVARFWVRGSADLVKAAAAERTDSHVGRGPSGNRGGGPSDFGSDVRFGVRALRRTPGFTLAALATLALGIGATTAMFSVVDVALRQGLPYPDADELVMGRATFNGNVNPWVAYPDYMDYRDQARSLESLATIGGRTTLVTITGAGEAEQASYIFVTGNLFETLGVRPILGGTFSIEELPESGGGEVVISHDFWQRRFGGAPDVLGRTLVADGNPLTVMGVMPGAPASSNLMIRSSSSIRPKMPGY